MRPLLVLAVFAWIAVAPPASADPAKAAAVRLFADTDDDDGDGRPDGDATPLTAHDVEWMDGHGQPLVVHSLRGSGLRVIAGKEVVTPSSFAGTLRAKRIGLQGIEPGKAIVDFGTKSLDVSVCEIRAYDVDGRRVDLVTSHASISRTLPETLSRERDRDALSWVMACPMGAVPRSVRIESFRPSGESLDRIEAAPLSKVECPPDVARGLDCGDTGPIRATVDVADRSHPAIADRSLRAEVGGRLVVFGDGRKGASIRVGGPRESAVGAIERYRAELRFHVVRVSPGGEPALGDAKESPAALAREEARTASMVWGQCGIHFGPEARVHVDVVDPPPRYLLALGCDLGVPASGGQVAFRIDGAPVHVETLAGEAPIEVAETVARAVEAAGFRAVVSSNARISPGALRTADVLVRRKNGDMVDLSPVPSEPLSTDPALSACLGDVDLADGLEHFDDLDAAAGTVEERTLVKAYADDDPKTIEVFVIPSFSKTGRIGESFIDADGSGIQNVVIVDRAGIRAGARSYALAHELGHVLLDMPGHPDDFGVDRPWSLMDADAADGTIFGPRRLSVEDCERAVRQSGPGAAIPLLTPWPLYTPRPRRADAK